MISDEDVEQGNSGDLSENNSNGQQIEDIIDLESLLRNDDNEKEVVDLTVSTSDFVDLTEEDYFVQASSQPIGKQKRKKKQHKLPYSRNRTVLDDSIEILPSSSSNSDSVTSSPQNVSKKVTCPICMEDTDQISRGQRRHVVSTNCGHIFCNKCLEDALKLKKNCPTCRKSLSLKQYHKLFI